MSPAAAGEAAHCGGGGLLGEGGQCVSRRPRRRRRAAAAAVQGHVPGHWRLLGGTARREGPGGRRGDCCASFSVACCLTSSRCLPLKFPCAHTPPSTKFHPNISAVVSMHGCINKNCGRKLAALSSDSPSMPSRRMTSVSHYPRIRRSPPTLRGLLRGRSPLLSSPLAAAAAALLPAPAATPWCTTVKAGAGRCSRALFQGSMNPSLPTLLAAVPAALHRTSLLRLMQMALQMQLRRSMMQRPTLGGSAICGMTRATGARTLQTL